MRIHNALAVAGSDRSAQIQAKNAADASRRVQDLYDAANRLKADSLDLERQTSADPESAAMAKDWSAQGGRPAATAFGRQPASESSGSEAPSSSTARISFWA